MTRPLAAVAAALAAAVALPSGVAAATTPIPQGSTKAPAFTGGPATPAAVPAPSPPRHPHMAPNERSNLHDDAYQTDTYRRSGPLGRDIKVSSNLFAQECASITFDSRGRLVTVCVGIADVTLRLLDPATLDALATYALPPREVGTDTFTNFTGGGYFYLDDHDRAVIPTTQRHIVVVGETEPAGFALAHDYDVSANVPSGDGIISALPDWSGRIWFASRHGVVGTVDPGTGAVQSVETNEPIGNSFAIDEDGGVYIVTDVAMARWDADATGRPQLVWREPYENVMQQKPGQTQAGSGTTPTLMGRDLVAITDNADPMNVVVYRRGRDVAGPREVCRRPVFEKGASSTDQSLIGTDRSLVVENNYGHAGPTSVENGKSTSPGIARVDVDAAAGRCRLVWTNTERAPSVVPKLALGSGLVYTYTKDPRDDREDPWFFTAIDFHSGRTVYRRLAGEGLGYNNNFAPVTIGPDGTAYLGVLGGVVRLADATPPDVPPAPESGPPPPSRAASPGRVRVRVGCARGGRTVVRATGAGVRALRVRRGTARAVTDRRRPFAVRLERDGHRLRVQVTLQDARMLRVDRRAPRCPPRSHAR